MRTQHIEGSLVTSCSFCTLYHLLQEQPFLENHNPLLFLNLCSLSNISLLGQDEILFLLPTLSFSLFLVGEANLLRWYKNTAFFWCYCYYYSVKCSKINILSWKIPVIVFLFSRVAFDSTLLSVKQTEPAIYIHLCYIYASILNHILCTTIFMYILLQYRTL